MQALAIEFPQVGKPEFVQMGETRVCPSGGNPSLPMWGNLDFPSGETRISVLWDCSTHGSFHGTSHVQKNENKVRFTCAYFCCTKVAAELFSTKRLQALRLHGVVIPSYALSVVLYPKRAL